LVRATNARTDNEVLLPGAPPVAGIRFRPFDMDRDLAPLVNLIVEANLADQDDYLTSVEDLSNELEHQAGPFDPARDMLVAEVDRKLVGGTIRSGRLRAGVVQHEIDGWVQPEQRRRGIGRALLQWTEARSREAAGEWAGSEPHAITRWVSDTQAGAIALLEAEGYGRVRYGFKMVRSLSDPIPDAAVPEGLEVRPVVEADHRRIWDADTEAFRDHWDAGERTEEDFVGWFSTPGIDTSMWRVAWDGDEVAGSVMNFVFAEENEKLGVRRGWLEHISVRRPWRRRGLAAALIADSLRELGARGLDEAALGVDAENLTGALRLYESLGFRRYRTGIAFRKPL
jgi:mycothiol synthase